jgi:opacity protein-like surface antigen
MDETQVMRAGMVKVSFVFASIALSSTAVFGDSLDFVSATTFSLASSGPVLHDTTTTPDSPEETQDRITLSDTGKNGWYVTPNVSMNLLSDFNNNNLSIEYDNGYAYGLTIGKEINPGFSLELDLAHIKNDLKSLTIQSGGGISVDVGDAKITQTPILFNAVWSPRSHDRLSPYFGIGGGAIKGKYSVSQLPGAFESLLDIDWAFAIQVKAGFTYALSHSSNLHIGYRFLHAHYGGDLDLNNSLVTAGLQFYF